MPGDSLPGGRRPPRSSAGPGRKCSNDSRGPGGCPRARVKRTSGVSWTTRRPHGSSSARLARARAGYAGPSRIDASTPGRSGPRRGWGRGCRARRVVASRGLRRVGVLGQVVEPAEPLRLGELRQPEQGDRAEVRQRQLDGAPLGDHPALLVPLAEPPAIGWRSSAAGARRSRPRTGVGRRRRGRSRLLAEQPDGGRQRDPEQGHVGQGLECVRDRPSDDGVVLDPLADRL